MYTAEAERIVKAAGDGEFVHVGELSKALLALYRADRVLLDKVEDALYKAPPPLSRGVPAIFCAAMRLLQAMLSLQTELGPIIERTKEFNSHPLVEALDDKENPHLPRQKLELKACCEVLLAQMGRADLQKAPAVLAILTSANIEKLLLCCRYTLDSEDKLLHAAEHGWEFLVRGIQDCYALIGFFKEADTTTIAKCRDSVLGLRDIGTGRSGQEYVVAMLGASEEAAVDIAAPELQIFGREAVVAELCEKVLQDGGCVLCHGRAGIGKSTVLRDVANRLSLRYDVFAVLDGLTEVSLYDGLLQLGRQHVKGLASDAALEMGAVRQVIDFLKAEEEWLLVIDNAVNADKVMKLLPEGVGHVLLADSSPDRWAPHGERVTHTLELEPLGISTLLQIVGKAIVDKEDIEEHQAQLGHARLNDLLLEELDALPLMARLVGQLINAGIKYLDTRTDFWRQQKPMYTR